MKYRKWVTEHPLPIKKKIGSLSHYIALSALGIPHSHLMIDKQSEKDFQRPSYQKTAKEAPSG